MITISMSEQEYKDLLENKKQNEEEENTWKNWYIKQLEGKQKEYDNKLKEIENGFINAVTNAIINSTHTIVFFSTMKGKHDIIADNTEQSVNRLFAKSIWKIIPNNSLKEDISWWKKIL